MPIFGVSDFSLPAYKILLFFQSQGSVIILCGRANLQLKLRGNMQRFFSGFIITIVLYYLYLE